MSQTAVLSRTQELEERLRRGADLLFDMEMRGETEGSYEPWLRRWQELLDEYETANAA